MIKTHNGRLAGLVSILSFTLVGCESSAPLPDAYGNFEAVETTISAQSDGELLAFIAEEGDRLEPGQIVGQIDTLQLSLSRETLRAQQSSLEAQIASVNSEVAVLRERHRVATVHAERVRRLFEEEAATQKQLDDVEGELSVLDRQIDATRSKASSLRSQIVATEAQIAQLNDRIVRSTVVNPLRGTVLTTFVEEHELVAAGKPLYRIADLSTLDLRAYVSADQLSAIEIGEEVDVQYDGEAGTLVGTSGTISWISSVAEFTPRTVQTRNERTNLVYAIKIRVPNPDGSLKIGMPGDVRFATTDL